jgi:predicted glycoside hydrolase/deacetylase ChbG (UPF0249 family)
MEAQFARFAATGLTWSHADGHQHFHLHPVVWRQFLDLCDRYGVKRIRLPHEELRAHLRAGGDRPLLNTIALLAFRVLRLHALRTLRAREAATGRAYFVCDRVYGQLQTGNMHTAYVLRLLERLRGETNEVYFHPGAPHARRLPPAEQTPTVQDVEMQALLTPEVRARLEAPTLRIGTYAQIECWITEAMAPSTTAL